LKTLITGAGGLVGSAMAATVAARAESVVGFDHAALDITDESKIAAVFQAERPDVVINCAAWTDVDGCETDRDRALAANAHGPELLARACREIDALFITVSTDYVFDGTKDGFYTQRDQPNPLSVYGFAKLEGERRAQTAWAKTIVVRSGYIFGARGTNFLSGFLSRARQGERLKAISDMTGTPTYAPDLAARIYDLARLSVPAIFHVVNAGSGATFEQFVRCALKIAGFEQDLVEAVSLKSLQRPAPRPANSRLRCVVSEAIGLQPLPTWQDAVARFVASQS
jgi:dTDP-4-dehydrorhamnose reductase